MPSYLNEKVCPTFDYYCFHKLQTSLFHVASHYQTCSQHGEPHLDLFSPLEFLDKVQTAKCSICHTRQKTVSVMISSCFHTTLSSRYSDGLFGQM